VRSERPVEVESRSSPAMAVRRATNSSLRQTTLDTTRIGLAGGMVNPKEAGIKALPDEPNPQTLITVSASSSGGCDRHRIADRTDAIAQHLEINAEIRMAEMLHDRFRQIGVARGGLGINIDGSAPPGP
jgi:hypothetical protein